MPRSSRTAVLLALAAIATSALSGCYLSHERAPDAGGIMDATTARRDAGTTTTDAATLPPCRVESFEVPVALDLLLVIDNSGSMTEEQVAVRSNVGTLVDALVRGDSNGDGVTDTFPARDLHVGVLTVGVLLGPPGPPGTTAADDGVLFNLAGVYTVPGCMPPFPRFQTWLEDGSRPREALLHDIDCVLNVGVRGTGIEEPLEATIKALSPSTDAPVSFLYGRGRGDRENRGFLRPESILAVLIVTDEDDCSVQDPDEVGRFGTCPEHALFPIDRYVDALYALHPPESVFVGIVGGIPEDLAGSRDWDAVLADPRMQEREDPRDPARPAPACEAPERGSATPGRRLVRFAQALGENAGVESVCATDFGGAIRGLLDRLGRVIRRTRCAE